MLDAVLCTRAHQNPTPPGGRWLKLPPLQNQKGCQEKNVTKVPNPPKPESCNLRRRRANLSERLFTKVTTTTPLLRREIKCTLGRRTYKSHLADRFKVQFFDKSVVLVCTGKKVLLNHKNGIQGRYFVGCWVLNIMEN